MTNNLIKLEFVALLSSGKNYLPWTLDAEIHLEAMGLGDTIKNENTASNQNRAKAMIFLRHHLDEILKMEYLTVKDPLTLWKGLKERYDNLKMVIHPKARYEWMHLRFQEYKSVHEYNYAMFRITSQLKLCGENINDTDMMEKTLSTFHASNVILQQQYREKSFEKYSELISHLPVTEQNNNLLMKNHENRPTGSTPLPEGNEVYVHHVWREKGRGPSRGRGHGRDYGQERNSDSGVNYSSNKRHHQKRKRKDEKREVSICFRCGGKGYYANNCHTPKHLVDLYQASLKNKVRNPEVNFIDENHVDMSHLDVADFFEHPEGRIDHLIGDDYVLMEE